MIVTKTEIYNSQKPWMKNYRKILSFIVVMIVESLKSDES